MHSQLKVVDISKQEISENYPLRPISNLLVKQLTAERQNKNSIISYAFPQTVTMHFYTVVVVNTVLCPSNEHNMVISGILSIHILLLRYETYD